MGMNTFLYNVILLLHLGSVIVGFGSAFVYPMLAVRARKLEPRQAQVINHATFGLMAPLSTYPVIAAGFFGILLVVFSDQVIEFKQTWISIAFLLWLAVLAIAFLLHLPNVKAMDALGERLASGEITPSKSGGEPKEVVEQRERAGKASAYSGMMHVLWLLLMIDMVWKPGLY